MTERAAPRILQKLGTLQARHPFRVLLVALISLLPAVLFALKLGFRPDFAELLPDNKDSVIEMRRVAQRLPGITTLTVTAEIADGKNEAALRAFVDRLVPKLEALGSPWIGTVDFGVHETKKFFDHNKLLFAKTEDLQKVHDDVLARYEWEVGKQIGSLLDEDDPPPPITAETIRDQLLGKSSKTENSTAPKTSAATKTESSSIHPNGYYMSADGRFAAVLVRTSISSKNDRQELRRKVEALVEEAGPTQLDPTMKIGYTGDLIISGEVYDEIVNDLGEVGIIGVAGVLGSVLLFFLRVRTVLVMALSLLVGLMWTFGITYFSIGYLNSSTGFLVSIIAGNGINYGIMYMARYMEARRDEGADVTSAIAIAHRDTWLPTISAAATGMLAYGSLVVTDFRGFKHFGIIGGYGMILCWVATYLFTPALLAASERILPMFKPGSSTKVRGYYGLLFSKLAHKFPRALTIVGAAVSLLSLVLTYQYLSVDPMEYDMKNVDNKRLSPSAALTLSVRVGNIVGRLSQDGMAVMTDRLDQVPLFAAELQKRYDAAPSDKKPFEKVVTIYSLLPEDQEEKIPLIEDLQRVIHKAKKRGFIANDDWEEISPYLPDEDLKPIGIEDLPEQVVRPFTEKDGTRGRIVYIVPRTGESVWDAKYLMRWADSFRYTELPTGEVIKGSGRAVIYADMIKAVAEDAPKAVAVAALGTILVILVAFRGHPYALGVFIPWLVGVSMLVGFLNLQNIKLNFLNFIALPITFGIGAEYAHNLMQRFRSEQGKHLERVFTETGGAIIVCSLTTTVGYLALMFSINRGTSSFGLAAAVGEITCLLSAVLFLPAFLVWKQKKSPADSDKSKGSDGESA